MKSRLPLDLFGEVTAPNGTRYKWDANQAATSRLQNGRFATKIGEGFSDGSGQLPRRIDQDYPDLGLINSVVFTGADGSIAYEGRLSALPRQLTDTHSIGVTLAGWMAHAKDRKFQEIYVDRDVSHWTDIPFNRKVALAGFQTLGELSWSSANGGWTADFPATAMTAQAIAELWYAAPAAVKIAKLQYRGTGSGTLTGWRQEFEAGDTDNGASADSYAQTFDDTLRTITLTTARRYMWEQLFANTSAITPSAGTIRSISKLGVFGNHGLTSHIGDPAEPDGFYGSDVIKNIASRFCPLLDTSGVEDSNYVIQNLAFIDPTFPYDAFLEINKYHLWHLGVWDNRILTWRPYDLTDYQWEIRTDDPGTTFTWQGLSTDMLFNGISVLYTDLLTGLPNILTPDVYTDLADSSTANPWNAWGIAHWDELQLSTPVLQADALQLGRAALADRNRPRTPGTITATGYIRDRAGVQQPVWKVRAGDTISVTNFPNDSPRLIVETDYDDESKQITLSIDRPFALLDAYLDRLSNALVGAGLQGG
jgi:hypothetical protein